MKLKHYLFTFFFILPILFLMQCDTNNDDPFAFKVEVSGTGLDCGDTYQIKFLDDFDEVYKITGSEYIVYYADLLPDELKEVGLIIWIQFRKPTREELYPCTCMGPAFPHIVVTDIIKIEE